MVMKLRYLPLALLIVSILVSGCGDSVSDFAVTPPPGETATIRLVSVLERSVPAQVTHIRLTGFDAEGQVRHTPEPRGKAATIDFEQVPISVKSVKLELLKNGQSVGTASTPVTLEKGQVTELRDIDYDNPLTLYPSSARSAQNGQRRYRLVYNDGGPDTDLTADAQWQSSSPLVTVTNGVAVIGATEQPETVTITATWRGMTQTSTLRVVPGRYVYALNSSQNVGVNKSFNTISSYAMDANGALSAVGNPVATGSFPNQIVLDPNGHFAYVPNFYSDSLSVYAISDTGELTQVGQPIGTQPYPGGICIDPTGRFAYIAAGNSVTQATVNGDGTLTLGSPTSAGLFTTGVAVDGLGKNLFSISPLGNPDACAFTIGGDGSLTKQAQLSLESSGSAGLSHVALSPSGDRAYVVGSNLVAFSTGKSAAKVGDTAVGQGPQGLALDPAGRFVYVANSKSDTISILTSSLGSLATIACAGGPTGLTVDASGRFLYATAFDSGRVEGYTINGDGTLSSFGSWLAQGCTNSIVITP